MWNVPMPSSAPTASNCARANSRSARECAADLVGESERDPIPAQHDQAKRGLRRPDGEERHKPLQRRRRGVPDGDALLGDGAGEGLRIRDQRLAGDDDGLRPEKIFVDVHQRRGRHGNGDDRADTAQQEAGEDDEHQHDRQREHRPPVLVHDAPAPIQLDAAIAGRIVDLAEHQRGMGRRLAQMPRRDVTEVRRAYGIAIEHGDR